MSTADRKITVADVLAGHAAFADITPLTCDDVDLRNLKAQAFGLARLDGSCDRPDSARTELAHLDFRNLATRVAGSETAGLALALAAIKHAGSVLAAS